MNRSSLLQISEALDPLHPNTIQSSPIQSILQSNNITAAGMASAAEDINNVARFPVSGTLQGVVGDPRGLDSRGQMQVPIVAQRTARRKDFIYLSTNSKSYLDPVTR